MTDIRWALTLTQPWATLVAIGAKSIETRSWATRYRGPIAIHAAKGFPGDARAICHELPFEPVLRMSGFAREDSLPRGAIVAVAVLVDVWQFDRTSAERIHRGASDGSFPAHEVSFGDFSGGRFGFRLADVRAIATPIPARGMLGLWALPDAVRGALNEAVRAPIRNGNATAPECVSGASQEAQG